MQERDQLLEKIEQKCMTTRLNYTTQIEHRRSQLSMNNVKAKNKLESYKERLEEDELVRKQKFINTERTFVKKRKQF